LGYGHVKAACKMLMKLTTGENFINIYLKALTHTVLKSAKKTNGLAVFFALLGFA